jgi:hypothetical protein
MCGTSAVFLVEAGGGHVGLLSATLMLDVVGLLGTGSSLLRFPVVQCFGSLLNPVLGFLRRCHHRHHHPSGTPSIVK